MFGFWKKKEAVEDDTTSDLDGEFYIEKYGDYMKYASCNKCEAMNDTSKFHTQDSCCTKCGNEEFSLVTARLKFFKIATKGVVPSGETWELLGWKECGYEILEKN